MSQKRKKFQFQGFYLIKLCQELDAKLLYKVPFSVPSTNDPNFFPLNTYIKEKSEVVF